MKKQLRLKKIASNNCGTTSPGKRVLGPSFRGPNEKALNRHKTINGNKPTLHLLTLMFHEG